MTDVNVFYDEMNDMLELPFIEAQGIDVVSYWSPPEVTGGSEENHYSAECVLGMAYAAYLIEHMIEWGPGKVDAGSLLNVVTRGVMKRGKWTGVEIGFFDAIGNYLVNRRISVTTGFKARMID